VELFACVELEPEIVVLVPNVTSEELLCPYETSPFENKIMEIAANPNITGVINCVFIIRG
jgi:hypothetical protein